MDQPLAEEPRPSVVVPRRGMVLAASLMATFMAAVESSIVATAMPTIVGELGGFDLFSWVFAAYLLAMAVSIPVYGRFADIYGRKRVFFAGCGVFLTGTTLCGLAGSMVGLILFRALQGLGAGAIQPIASTIVGDIYTPAERARVQGYISSVFGVSAIIGPALGAFLVEQAHWSFVFWINLPIGAASITMFALYLREKVERRPHRIDYLGAVLLVAGITAPMLALVGASRFAAGEITALAGGGALVLILFAIHERRTPEPMMPFRLWRQRVIALSNFGVFGSGATMIGVAAFLPTFVQGVMGRSPGIAGFVLGCMSVSWMFSSMAAGRLMIRTSYRLSAALGGVALVAGSAMLADLDAASSVAWAAAGSLVVGIGMGACNTAFLVSLQASVGWGERGVATASNMFMRMLGQSVGAALCGAVLNYGVNRRLPGAGDAVDRLLDPAARQGLGAAAAPLAEAVGAALFNVHVITVAVAALTLLLTVWFPAGLSPVRPARPRAARRSAASAD